MEQIRKFPSGLQSFEVLRESGYLYVDKTAHVYRLVSEDKSYFFSRPRRFGKSLLISTFKAYFEGRRDLFEGLAIAELESKWDEYPVFHLDLNAEKYDSENCLVSILSSNLRQWETKYGKDDLDDTLSRRFEGVIRCAYEKTGKRVVVLIDEYDKPLLNAILDENLLKNYRASLKAFYGVLKSAGEYLRFVFLTGVTKFSQVSVFSDLNHLVDISFEEDYVQLCGFTKNEILQNFTPDIKRLAEKNKMTFDEAVAKITQQYDGYHFAANTEGIFNPFSLLKALEFRNFKNHWFQTGTPTYLIELLKENDYNLCELIDGVEAESYAFADYRADVVNPIPMIYQSGYLTIKGYDEEYDIYTLKFPNDEVRYGFIKFLMPYYTSVRDASGGLHVKKFCQDIKSGNVDGFMERLKVFFAKMSYELNNNNEKHYQAVLYVIFTLIGEHVDAEVRGNKGRADAVVKTRDTIYVFEFKLNGAAEEAMAQINNKGYLIPYKMDGRKLVKIGVEFSKEERNIYRYIVE